MQLQMPSDDEGPKLLRPTLEKPPVSGRKRAHKTPRPTTASSVASDSVQLPAAVGSDGEELVPAKRAKRKPIIANDPDGSLETNLTAALHSIQSRKMPGFVMNDSCEEARTYNDDISEVYSAPRVTLQAHKFGLVGDLAVDLSTGYNLLDRNDEIKCILHLNVRKPRVVILSPPCTMFSQLQHGNWGRMHGKWEKLRNGVQLLDFAVELAVKQTLAGRAFILEHPVAALSWRRPNVLQLLAMPGVATVEFDQCMVGLATPISGAPIQKRTRLATNLPAVVQVFTPLQCKGSHGRHGHCQGSEGGIKMSTHCQKYPDQMVHKLLEGIVQSLRSAKSKS